LEILLPVTVSGNLSYERYTLIRPIEEASVISSSGIIHKAAGPATVAY
jgi:hypothetical protein